MNHSSCERKVVGLLINYRDAARSIRCIHSLLEESMSVIVWDNSADEGSSALEIERAFAHSDDVKVHVSPGNLGFAAGINRALTLCAKFHPGAWQLVINNDATLRRGGAARLRDALAGNPGAVLAFPDINHGGTVFGPRYYLRTLGLILPGPGPGRFPYPSGCCLLLASDRFSQRWFDEDFFMYGEDCELGWRLRDPDGLMVHVTETLVDHEGSASSVAGSVFYETRMAAAHLMLADKLSLGGFDKLALYLGRALMLLTRATVRSLRYQSLNPWVGLREGIAIALERKSAKRRRVTA